MFKCVNLFYMPTEENQVVQGSYLLNEIEDNLEYIDISEVNSQITNMAISKSSEPYAE